MTNKEKKAFHIGVLVGARKQKNLRKSKYNRKKR